MIFATKHRKLVLFLFSIITIFFGYKLTNISFGHDMDDFFDKKEEVYLFNKDFFSQFKEVLPNNVIIGIKKQEKIDYELIVKIDSLASRLKQNSFIKDVYSITNQQLVVFSSFGTLPYSVLNLETKEDFDLSFKELDSLPDIKNKYISEDKKSSVFYLEIQDSLPIDSLLVLKSQVEKLASDLLIGKIVFVNTIHNNHLITTKIKKDTQRMISIAFFLIIIILLYFFRSLAGIFIPFVIVVSSIIWVMGTIAAFGVHLNVLTVAIPVIVGVISLSDVIHIISRYSEEKSTDKLLKIKVTQKDILKAIVLTTLTTSIGFLSLANSNIKVFTEFALYTAVGVFYAFVLAYFILPILLYSSKKITLHNTLERLTPTKIHTKPVLVITVICFIIIGIGISKVKHDNYVFENLNKKDDISQVMNFMEKEMYGIRDITLTVSVPNLSYNLFDKKILGQLNDIETFIENEYVATIDVGLAARSKQVNRALNGGLPSFYTIPDDEYGVNRIKNKLLKHSNFVRLKSFVNFETNSTFIKTKTKDQGSYKTRELNDELLKFAKQNTPDLDVNFGGTAFIIDETNVNVSEGMIWNLLIIVVLIFLIVSFIFKSIAVGFYSLFPNIIPLLAITAVVGLFGYGMNIATTIVYTIAFGIAVDDTIHFLGRYKIELDNGIKNHQALLNTIKTSGGAIFLTSLVLVTGFGVLITSTFFATFITGLLVCVGMIAALLCDLYLLPVLLLWLKKEK
ncbi:MMPL family transporter [Flavobacteriales bacterium]|nr:MMPL family transporter [Flavobacteriales bacterium]MDB4088844.1 MMPL family transporter [Flavobacteriales bacterium]